MKFVVNTGNDLINTVDYSCFVCNSFGRSHCCPWNSLQSFLFLFNRGFQIASITSVQAGAVLMPLAMICFRSKV